MVDPNDALQKETSLQRERERLQAREQIEQDRPPWEYKSGVEAVVAAVRDLRFPLSADEIVEKAGDREVKVSDRNRFPVAALVRKLKKDTFVSPGDLEEALLRHWEAIEFMEIPQEQRPWHGGPQPQQAGDSRRRGVGRE